MLNQKYEFLSIEGDKYHSMVYDLGIPNNIKKKHYPTLDLFLTKPINKLSFYKYHVKFMEASGLMLVGTDEFNNTYDYYIKDHKKASILKLKYEL